MPRPDRHRPRPLLRRCRRCVRAGRHAGLPRAQVPGTAKLTRSEVIATLKAAPAAEATANEASPAPQAVSTLSRAQVQAEAREALRLA